MSKDYFTDPLKLAAYLKIEKEKLLLDPQFPLKVPLRLAKKMKKKNLKDPLLRQFVPLKDELKKAALFLKDPLQEEKIKHGHLLCRYKKRALLLCSPLCAMHCRYCFRKNSSFTKSKSFAKEIAFIKKNKLDEVILSGGDPLSLSDMELKKLLAALSFVKRVRFHSRYLIGDPKRISSSFLKILANFKKAIIFVLQINHPLEIDREVKEAIFKIQRLGIPVLSQSVLLKGVNDDFLTLKKLLEKLINIKVIPYYLHQLDKEEGTKHFQVEIKKGQALIKKLKRELPGYAIPRYVVDNQDSSCKTDLLY
jgi:L-lysine 2,3-aminomutase